MREISPPVADDWDEGCHRADHQRLHEEGFAKGTPVVSDKVKS